MISIIVACDENNLIGNNNAIPWKVPEDLRLFKKRTLGNVIIMGKNTWRSLPRLFLDGRINIVVSSNSSELFKETFFIRHSVYGPIFEKNIENAIIQAKGFVNRSNDIYSKKGIFIIGGQKIYEEALNKNLVDKIYLSRIKGKYTGDKFFPQINESFWNKKIIEKYDNFDVFIYEKK